MHHPDSNWWQKYRREKYKSNHVLSKEMVLRKSFSETLKEFFNNWSVACIRHITDPNFGFFERFFWLVVFATALSTLGFCLYYIWSALSSPMIVSMESTTYPISNIDFPAVALCNVNRISLRRAEELAEEIFKANKNKRGFNQTYPHGVASVKKSLISLGQLISFENNEKLVDEFLFKKTADVIGLMKTLAPNCSDLLIRCAWGGFSMSPCTSGFRLRRTTHGHCCVFNYVLKSAAIYDQIYNVKDIQHQVLAGDRFGLVVVANPQAEDYAYPLHSMIGFDIFFFDPRHFPDVTGGKVIHHFVEINTVARFHLNSRVQMATEEVRKYSPSTRNCLLNDEWPSEYGNMYSMSACLSKCRVKAIQSLCKCTPYYMPITTNDGMVCTGDKLWCLNKHKEKFYYLYPHNPETWIGLEQERQDSAFCTECLPDCEHTLHEVRASKNTYDINKSEYKRIFKMNFVAGINMTNKCAILVYQNTPDGTLDRLDIVLYWFEFLSNFGGFAGLLLGLTFYSAYECVYYWGIYFFRVVNQKRTQ